MTVDNRVCRKKTNGKTGSILNADGNANPVTMLKQREMKFATFGKMDLQFWEKRFAILWKKFLQKTV
jgi:hypothetical protein